MSLKKGGQGPGLPFPPRSHEQEATLSPSPAGKSKRDNYRAMGCTEAPASTLLSALAPELSPGVTYSVKEVSELVLLKAGNQKVIWGLQYTLFEPKGAGRLVLTGKYRERCCDCHLSPHFHLLSPTPHT